MARTEEESGRLSLRQTVQAKLGASGEDPFRTKKGHAARWKKWYLTYHATTNGDGPAT